MAKKKCGSKKHYVYFPSTDTEVCFTNGRKRKSKKRTTKKRVARKASKPVSVPAGKRKGDTFTKNNKRYVVVSFLRNGKRVRFARAI